MAMKNKNENVLLILGLLLIVAALFLFVRNISSDRHAETAAEQTIRELRASVPMEELVPAETAATPTPEPEEGEEIFSELEIIPNYILDPTRPMPTETIDGVEYIGVLTIPSLSLELPVASEWSYDTLKIAPCRYYGSAYTGDLVIVAHNYSRHFGSIRTLVEGDEVILADFDGNIFRYKVALTDTLEATAIEEMTQSGFPLTLFTCTVGGQYRVTVRCIEQRD